MVEEGHRTRHTMSCVCAPSSRNARGARSPRVSQLLSRLRTHTAHRKVLEPALLRGAGAAAPEEPRSILTAEGAEYPHLERRRRTPGERPARRLITGT